MYVLTNGRNYIGLNSHKTATSVANIKKALLFSEEKKAINFKENLKSTLKKFDWHIKKLDSNDEKEDCVNSLVSNEVANETELNTENFNVFEFFDSAIKTVVQLEKYASKMASLEEEYNKKIQDVRHYKRDIRTKLNAIQLQRLEQFEIKLERERYDCKSNKTIAEMFLFDLNRMKNPEYIERAKNVRESEYKPRILTFDMIDSIVGKR